ncbi:hypothetical protein [Salinibacillus aidingensis]
MKRADTAESALFISNKKGYDEIGIDIQNEGEENEACQNYL